MSRYGVVRPWLAIGREWSAGCKARLGAVWSQRRLEVDAGVRLASSVRFRGNGHVVIGAGAVLGADIQLIAETEATIVIGAGSQVGARSRLCARRGQQLELGAETTVEEDVTILSVAGVETGPAAVIGARTAIVCREPAGQGRFFLGRASHLSIDNLVDVCADVLIGDDVRTGPNCAFYTHKHSPSREELIWDRPVDTSPISVGSAVWIGHGCQVMPGIEIGQHAVVGAGSVVTKDVAAGVVVGGIPAREIRQV